MTNTEWLDNVLNNKIFKEATIVPQGQNAQDHLERKIRPLIGLKA